ncbi:hypothetical protein D4764_07G0008510 [Takifugu flavidus]|uniref:Uncharacterized protein n=1 Tax=Takifugu flavidus TaxID=433684 RepID=A0A5C6MSC7_9TELE|nr:hypothetical protein D4764_07G0008510 [Takifugu flavidus]
MYDCNFNKQPTETALKTESPGTTRGPLGASDRAVGGVHQVALLTHVDLVCPETAQDVTNVYKSRVVQAAINRAAALLGVSTSYIVPVKNYSSELDVDHNTDVLLLNAVDHILQYADLYFLDNSPPPDCETP